MTDWALHKLLTNPDYKPAQKSYEKIDNFFYSDQVYLWIFDPGVVVQNWQYHLLVFVFELLKNNTYVEAILETLRFLIGIDWY